MLEKIRSYSGALTRAGAAKHRTPFPNAGANQVMVAQHLGGPIAVLVLGDLHSSRMRTKIIYLILNL